MGHGNYETVNKDSILLKPLQEQKALKHLENTKKKTDTLSEIYGKKNQASLSFNKPLALSRFSSLEKKFEKNPEFANKYKEIINDYVNKGHAVKLSEEKSRKVTSITNYVSLHGVVNINKLGKIRVVFDTAAEFQNTSLNKTFWKF